jgi:hypothetical protein
MFGRGYRIYFGKDGDSIIVLLVGGNKGSQAKDIARARGFWRDYLEAKRHGKAIDEEVPLQLALGKLFELWA